MRVPLEITAEITSVKLDERTMSGDVMDIEVRLNNVPMYEHRAIIMDPHDQNDWDGLHEKAIDGFLCKLRDVLR